MGIYDDSLQGCSEVREDEWRPQSKGYDYVPGLPQRLSEVREDEWRVRQQGKQAKPTLKRKASVEFQTQVSLSSTKDGNVDSAGLGKKYVMQALDHKVLDEPEEKEKIGELAATSICGNDITASCFYVVGELAKNAGVYGPVCTVLSSITLFCFRSIYGEVVTALPLNGCYLAPLLKCWFFGKPDLCRFCKHDVCNHGNWRYCCYR